MTPLAALALWTALTASPPYLAAIAGGVPGIRPAERAIGLGASCYVADAHTYGLLSYSVRDLGKKRVPKVALEDAAMLKRIERYVRSKTLRFAYSGTNFVVFDARNGPCQEYRALNLYCNAGYDPIDRVDGLTAFAGSCMNTPRPWMKDDVVGGKVPWPYVYDVTPR